MKKFPQLPMTAVILATASICAAADAPAPPPAPAKIEANTPDASRAMIAGVVKDALAALRDDKLTKAEKRQKVEQIAYDHMDIETLSRLALGKYWRTLSDAQQKDFVQEFKKHVTATYSHASDDYTDQDVKITASRAEADGDCTVDTQITGTDANGAQKAVAKVNYRVRLKDGQLKIIDVSIEGVSLAINFRSQFDEIMSKGGIDQLMKVLKEKNAAAEKE